MPEPSDVIVEPNNSRKPDDTEAASKAEQFEKLVAELSNALVMTPAHRIDDTIYEWMERAAQFLDLEGAAVCQFSPDRLSARLTHTWMAPDLPPLPETLGDVEWPWVFDRLKEGKSVAFRTREELPLEAREDIGSYRAFGIVSCLSVPLACDGGSIGAFAMGTLRRQYTWSDAIVQRIRLVGELLGVALVRKRVQEELEQQLRFEETIGEVSAALMAASGRSVLQVIPVGLERIARLFGVDRCSIFEFSRDGTQLTLAHVWAATEVPVVAGIDLDRQFPWIAEEVRRGQVLPLNGIDDLPGGACQDRQSWASADLKSALLATALIEGTPRYVLALACTRSPRRWPERLIPRMKIVGSIFADTLERMHADREIEMYVTRCADAQRIAHLGNWEWDLLNDELTWSDEVYRIFDITREQFNPSMDAFWDFVHPNDLEAVREEARRATSGPDGIYSIDHRIVRRDGTIRVVRELAVPEFDHEGRPVRLAGTVQDITEMHTAYLEIRRLKDQLEAENVYLREELHHVTGHGDIVGTSETIRRVVTQAEQVAPTDSTVLILGETGTGKELLAHFIHNHSLRKNRPFITTNLAAIPATLIESELFGREKGAFTGALTKQTGRFEAADGGTIFLDEIGEMPADTQAKLLRVLQSGELERLGSSKTLRVDVRVIAATNRDLTAAVREGKFRDDLYYRLNVFPITVPPLRERREDIPELTWTFIKELGEKMGKPIDHVKRTAMADLQAYQWPGNIRELRNVIERSMILTPGQDLNVTLPGPVGVTRDSGLQLLDMERSHIQHILEMTAGRIRGKGGAAELLGLKPSTLYSRMKKLNIRQDARQSSRLSLPTFLQRIPGASSTDY